MPVLELGGWDVRSASPFYFYGDKNGNSNVNCCCSFFCASGVFNEKCVKKYNDFIIFYKLKYVLEFHFNIHNSKLYTVRLM